MNPKNNLRTQRLLPDGQPRYVRCYDNEDYSDRYTVIFTGNYQDRVPGSCSFVGMSAQPFHPQGIGQHGTATYRIDEVRGWPPKIGRRGPLGKRIRFEDLPEDCRKLVMQDYKELWKL